MPPPAYITRRITQGLARPSEVEHSTPVLGFGNFLEACVATIGLNPSKREFLSPSGHLLVGAAARLESLTSLGLADLVDASTTEQQRILDACLAYFARDTSYHWFDRFTPILEQLGC